MLTHETRRSDGAASFMPASCFLLHASNYDQRFRHYKRTTYFVVDVIELTQKEIPDSVVNIFYQLKAFERDSFSHHDEKISLLITLQIEV